MTNLSTHEFRQCSNQQCRLRFPMPQGERPGDHCPRCGASTTVQCTVLVGEEAVRSTVHTTPLPLRVLVDNVRSTFNVGSIFRSADGAGFQQLFLCGITPTPTNPKLAKTALGAEEAVAWSYHANSVDCAHLLRQQGHTLWALEEHPHALSLFAAPLPPAPLVLIVGNEVTGVDPALLTLCDQTVALPMYGIKRSLNVATAFGAAAVILAQRLMTVDSGQ
ncbi:MAG: RNA methyltransferase [Caldilineaceae bacterium]|nr:RNA methyltransferase [Caldilineaceae bacterium]